jgi:uncharacterized protein YggE
MNKTVVLILSCLMSFSAMAADLPSFPFVVANGVAEKKVAPDIATIHLSILAFEKESELALKATNDTTTKVTQILAEYGVGNDKIEATDIRKNTIRKRDSEYNALNILGYEVSRSLTIRLDNLTQYSDIMGNIIGTNNVSGVRAEFDVSNRKALEAELVAIAGADAKEKANAMAKGLGTTVRSVYAISQSSSFNNFIADFGATSMQSMVLSRAAGGGSYETLMFAPETITLEKTLNVMFRIK